MPSGDGVGQLRGPGPQLPQTLQSRRQPGPFIGDERQQKSGATRGAQCPCRSLQILDGQIVPLKINACEAVHLRVEQCRRNPGIVWNRARRGAEIGDEAVPPLQNNRLTGRVVSRGDFALPHEVISVLRARVGKQNILVIRSRDSPSSGEHVVEVIIRPNPDSAARLVASLIAKDLRANPHLVLGLATGRTMEMVYGQIVGMHRDERLDFSLCRTFNLDEYVGLPPDDPRSYRYYMSEQLFRHVNIDPRNTHLPDGMAKDLDVECEQYELAIRRFGGIDLQLLGIGRAGHIGFNEPLSAFKSRTRVKALAPLTLEQNAGFFGGADKVPRRAITMGVGTILESRRCLLLATGGEKAEIIGRAVEGPITSMISATALQLHE